MFFCFNISDALPRHKQFHFEFSEDAVEFHRWGSRERHLKNKDLVLQKKIKLAVVADVAAFCKKQMSETLHLSGFVATKHNGNGQ